MKKKKLYENIGNKINYYLIIDRYVNISNLDKISKKDIEKIKKKVDISFFENYIIKLIVEWEDLNKKSYGKHLRKFKKIIKKYNLQDNTIIKNKIFTIESRAFTDLRSLKTLEAPYDTNKYNIEPFIIFNYKNIKFFKYESKFINYVSSGDVFISRSEIVIWNKNTIVKIIKRNDVKEIILRNYGIQINCKNKTFYIKYHDLQILYTSLSRVWKRKIKFYDKSKYKKNNIIRKIFN